MNKLIRLSKTGIEYGDLAWNLYSGCENWYNGVCPVGLNCWAKKITERFPSHYPNGFHPTFYPESFLAPLSVIKPKRILVAFMGDLFGDWIKPEAKVPAPYGIFEQLPEGQERTYISFREAIFNVISSCPQHTFLFLTKCPQNLSKWGQFPDNCRVGVTATDAKSFLEAGRGLERMKANIKFISLEPLLDYIGGLWMEDWLKSGVTQWLIIGQQTPVKQETMPKLEWVKEIVEAADRAKAPVFLKNNLVGLLPIEEPYYKNDGSGWAIRQEFPEEKKQCKSN